MIFGAVSLEMAPFFLKPVNAFGLSLTIASNYCDKNHMVGMCSVILLQKTHPEQLSLLLVLILHHLTEAKMTRTNPGISVGARRKLNPELSSASKKLRELKKGINYVDPVLEIIGNRSRLQVVLLLSQHDRLCVTDFCLLLDMSAPALSQHLRKMRETGMVTTKRDHKTVYYSLHKKFEDILNPLVETVKTRSGLA